MSRPVRLSFAIAFFSIAAVYFVQLIGGLIPILAVWLSTPLLLLSAGLVGWRLEHRYERRAICAEDEDA